MPATVLVLQASFVTGSDGGGSGSGEASFWSVVSYVFLACLFLTGISCLGASVAAGAGTWLPSKRWEGNGEALAVDVDGTARDSNCVLCDVDGAAIVAVGVDGTARYSNGSLLECDVVAKAAPDSMSTGLPNTWELTAKKLDGLCFALSSSCARRADEVAKAAQFQPHRVALGHCKTMAEPKYAVHGQTPERLAQQIL